MRFLRGISLRYRIAAAVILGLAVLLSVFGYLAVRAIGQTKDVALEERLRLAQATAGSVDALVQHTARQLEAAADMAKAEPAACGGEQVQSLFHILATFDAISCLDAQGQVVWTTPSEAKPAGTLVSADFGFPKTLRSDEATILQLPAREREHPPIAVVVAPIPASEEDPAQALVGELHLSHAGVPLVSLPEQDDSKDAEAEIVDARGFIIARANGGEVVEAEQHAVILQNLIADERSGTKIHEDHVVAYYPLSSLPGGVVVEQRQDAALAVPRDLQRTALIFGVGAVIVASAAAWFHARSVVKPIGELTDASRRIAGGSLDDPVVATRDDEVGTLARSFDAMRVRLKESREQKESWEKELEERVRLRTRELQQRNRELAALNIIASSVSRSLDIETIMSTSLDEVLKIMKADAGSVVLAEDHGTAGSPGVQRGLGSGSSQPCLDRDNENCQCAKAMLRGEAILIDDLSRDRGSLPDGCRARGFGSMVAVPLRAKDRSLGVILVASQRTNQFDSADLALLAAIGNTVGVAVENALLHGELRDKEEIRSHLLDRAISAQEEERKRIARELHDESAQVLATLLVEIGAAEDTLPASARRAHAILGRAKADATRALSEMRQMILDLRPSALDDLGLVAAVQWYAKTRLEQAGITAALEVEGRQQRLPAPTETALFRIAQEAINNVVKHADARSVSVRLNFKPASVSLLIEDNGRGFGARTVANGNDKDCGLGLLGMKERAALLGGTASIESRPGRGTRVAVEVPLEKQSGRQ